MCAVALRILIEDSKKDMLSYDWRHVFFVMDEHGAALCFTFKRPNYDRDEN